MQGSPQDGSTKEIDFVRWLRRRLEGIFQIRDITTGALQNRAVRITGEFLIDTAQAYAQLRPVLAEQGRTLLFRQEDGSDVIYAVEGVLEPEPNNKVVPLILGIITLLSILVTHTLYAMESATWRGFLHALDDGALFAVSLAAILLSHEFAHYLMARRHGVAVTLPYLIPFPLSPFGTMGAVIRIKDVPPNRRAMLMIGIAGPLAGLIVAIPILIVGLSLSPVTGLPADASYMMEGNSLLYGLLKLLVHGRWLPSQGQDVFLHPLAFAGWAGLLVTSFNLLPAGQLDGGHVAYALLHDKARYVTWGIIAGLLALGFVWNGWFLWAGLIFLFSRKNVVPLDDISPLRRTDILLAILLFLLFVLTFTPVPMDIVGQPMS